MTYLKEHRVQAKDDATKQSKNKKYEIDTESVNTNDSYFSVDQQGCMFVNVRKKTENKLRKWKTRKAL